HRHDGDRQRIPAAVDEACEKVSPVGIRAEEEAVLAWGEAGNGQLRVRIAEREEIGEDDHDGKKPEPDDGEPSTEPESARGDWFDLTRFFEQFGDRQTAVGFSFGGDRLRRGHARRSRIRGSRMVYR